MGGAGADIITCVVCINVNYDTCTCMSWTHVVMEEGETGLVFPGGRPEDKILYDLLVCCKWPEVATGLVSMLNECKNYISMLTCLW